MGLTNNTGKLSNTLTSNGTQITLGGSTVTDGNLLNIIGNQSSVNVGLVLNNTNGTYPKIYGLQNVNNNFVLYDYSASATRLTISSSGAATFSSSVKSDGVSSEGKFIIERDSVATNTIIGSLDFTNNNAVTTYGKVFGGRNSAGDGYVALGTGVSNNLYALETGNVAIGRSTADSLLHIFDSASGSNKTYIKFTCGDGGHIRVGKNDGVSNDAVLGTWSNNSILFFTQSTQRMTIGSDGTIGINRSNSSDTRLIIKSIGNSGATYALTIQNGSNVNMFYVRDDNVLFAPSIYSNTYSNAANVYVGADGAVGRSTSSLKYKADVIDYSKGLNEVMKLRPVSYKSKNPNEEGLTFAGLIAEEVHDLGLTEFVQYAEDGTPDALAYTHMIALLTKAIQELSAKVSALENK